MATTPASACRAKDSEPWLDDFTFPLTEGQIEQQSQDPLRYEVFFGSKPIATGWVSLAGALGGGFGGLLASGALWSSLLGPPACLAGLVVAWAIVDRATIALFGKPLRFLANWCLFWGLLLGLSALWGAQLDSPYWAYGVAAGMGFLIAITHGAYEPPDMTDHDAWFGLGTLLGPAAVVAAVWADRNLLDNPGTLAGAAMTGIASALIFLAPVMAMLFPRWGNEARLRHLIALYLHNDNYLGKALALLNGAIRKQPGDAALLHLRGLAHLLRGNAAAAEENWRRLFELQPNSVEPLVARGAFLVRRDRIDEARTVLEQAVEKAPEHARALATLGLVHHRGGDRERAIALYERAIDLQAEPLTVTRLAAALYEAGRYREALARSEEAIVELDSLHGHSWLVRARAHLALGHLSEAEEDFRFAYENAGEDSVAEEAREGLEKMGLEAD